MLTRWTSLVFLLIALPPSWSLAQNGEPSLEDLEQMGGELDQKAEAVAPPESAPGPAIDTTLMAPASPASIAPAAASMPSGLQPIDVRGRSKRVSEPNLFAGAPPLPGTLRNMAMGEAPEEYEVHEGDNLFDICDQLLDEANYWPKLWAFNPTIANPHFVYPGMKLRFYGGDEDNPPFLRVVTEDDLMPVNKAGVVESELVREDIGGMLMRSELPENSRVIDPRDLGTVPGIDEMFVVAGNHGADFVETNVIIPGFVVSDKFPILGTVVGGSAGSFLLDKGQDVIIEEEIDEGMQVGSSYTVVRPSQKVYTTNGNDFVGYRYEFIAQLKVKAKQDDIYKGRVSYNRLGIQPGDRVIAYRSAKRTIPATKQALSLGKGNQVVAFTEPFMLIGGRGGFVFIDQTEQKLREGETYELLQNVKAAAPLSMRSDLPDTDHKVARVHVVDISGSAALGYIVSDAFEVRLGDRIR